LEKSCDSKALIALLQALKFAGRELLVDAQSVTEGAQVETVELSVPTSWLNIPWAKAKRPDRLCTAPSTLSTVQLPVGVGEHVGCVQLPELSQVLAVVHSQVPSAG
jgi:hypothetical protein